MYVLLSSLGVPSLSADGVLWGIARLLVEAVGIAFAFYLVVGILLILWAGPARRRAQRKERRLRGPVSPQTRTGPADPNAVSVPGPAGRALT
jgi:hypothetical protein